MIRGVIADKKVMKGLVFLLLIFAIPAFAQTSGQAAGLTSAQVSARLTALEKKFYANPSLANLTLTSEALSKLKNSTTWIAKHPQDPVSLRFKKFHLSLLEITRANAKLSACTKGTTVLKRKVDRLMDGVTRMNRGGARAVCDLPASEKKQALDDLDVYSALIEQQTQPTSQTNLFGNDEKLVRMMVQQNDPALHSDVLRPGSPVFFQDPRLRKAIADDHARANEEKVRKIMLANGKDIRESGEATDAYIDRKYGFDHDRLKDLHLALMEGNRVNCLRNYLYYTQRFSFTDAKEKITASDPYRDVESKARDLFGRYKTYGGYSTLPEYAIGSGAKDDIVNLGVKDLKSYSKRYRGHPQLSEDDVLSMLKPAIDEAVKTEHQADEVRNSKTHALDNAADQAQARSIKMRAEYAIRSSALQRAFQKAKSSEVGFVVFTDAFRSKLGQLATMSLDEKRKMIRDAVQENVAHTRKYADWISANQGTTDFFNRDKSADEYQKISQVFLYSSPSVIQNAIAKNPKLMGSLCGVLKGAAKLRNDDIPDWVIWGGGSMMLVGGPVAPIAGTAFGLATTLALNAAHAEKAKALGEQKEMTGLGEYALSKNWDEIEGDRKELSQQIDRHQDAILNNWVAFAAGEAGGRMIPSLNLSELRIPASVRQTTESAEALLGRSLNESEMKAVYQAHIAGRGEEGKLAGSFASKGNYTPAQLKQKTEILRKGGFSDEEARRLIREGVAGDASPQISVSSIEVERNAEKRLKKIPNEIHQRFESWKKEVKTDGLLKVREQPRYHDELLFRCPDYVVRSVRLGLKYRVIYTISNTGAEKTLNVIDFNDHQKSSYGKEYGCR